MNRSDEQQSTESRLGRSKPQTGGAPEYPVEESAPESANDSPFAVDDAGAIGPPDEVIDEEGMGREAEPVGVEAPSRAEVEALFEAPESAAPDDDLVTDGNGEALAETGTIPVEASAEAGEPEPEPASEPEVGATEPEPVVAMGSSGGGYFYERRRNPGRRWADNIRRLAVVCATVAGLLLTVAVLRYLSWVLVPFAAAIVLAYLLNPIANAFHQATKRRGLAVALTVVVVLGATGAISWQVLPLMGGQLKTFGDDLNTTWLNVHRSIAYTRLDRTYMPDSIEAAVMPDSREATISKARSEVGWREFMTAWQEYIKNPETDKAAAFAKIRESTGKTYLGGIFDNTIVFIQNRPLEGMISATLQGILTSGQTALTSIIIGLALVGVFIVALVYLVLLLADFPEYARVWTMFLPANYHGLVVNLASEFHGAMSQYLVRQAVAAVLTGVLFALGFSYANLPMAVPFGLFVGLLSMIPYLQWAGIAPAVMLGAFQALHDRIPFTPLLLSVLITFVVVQLIQELILKPFIVGRGGGFERMGLLLGAFIWPLLLHWPLGVVVAIPFTCLIIAVYRFKARQLAAETEAAQYEAEAAWEA